MARRKPTPKTPSEAGEKASDLIEEAPAARLGRGPVDAPGKRHRKPPPQEPINKRMGEPTGKQMGQKNAKTGRRGGRG